MRVDEEKVKRIQEPNKRAKAAERKKGRMNEKNARWCAEAATAKNAPKRDNKREREKEERL